jgi:hypothetical protein
MEHAFQLEATHLSFEPLCIGVDVARGGFVSLALGELEELRCVRYTFGGALDFARVGGEARPLTSQLLRPFGFGPNGRIFQLAPYLFEALLLEIVLKETPVRRRYAPRGL